jgi:hypothetical protein
MHPEYEFDALSRKKCYSVVAISGRSVKTNIQLTLKPVNLHEKARERGTIKPILTNLSLDKLKKRIAFAKKSDDGLYDQDGSSRGAEVVWKAIEAYIESRKN